MEVNLYKTFKPGLPVEPFAPLLPPQFEAVRTQQPNQLGKRHCTSTLQSQCGRRNDHADRILPHSSSAIGSGVGIGIRIDSCRVVFRRFLADA